MNLKTKKLDASKIEIEIEVSTEDFEVYVNRAASEMGKDISVEGFRKGKAPKDIVENRVGKEHVLEHAAEHAVESFYRMAVEELKIEPIDRPEAEILKLANGNPFIFKVIVPILPEIVLPDYKSIASKIEEIKVNVEEKEIEETLNWLQKSRAKFSLKDGIAENGDLVEIEYSCPQISEIGQAEAQKDAFILGEGKFIPGFEENILGSKANEKKNFVIKATGENFPETLKGKNLEFTVLIKSIQKIELPEVNDEFAKTVGKFNNVEELKSNIKEGVKLEKENAQKQKTRETILDEIEKVSSFEIPEILIEREREAMIENMKHEVSHKFNISFEEYLKQINKSEEEITSSLSEEAKKRVKKFLILREIGNKEDVQISDAEIEEEINKTLRHYPDNKEVKEKKNMERLMEYNRGILKNEKIFSILEGFLKNKN